MRIVGGSLGGRVLKAPHGAATRPTSEKVREALFNILDRRVDVAGGHVLDLFAGSGALAIEALSRGAAHATLVDRARPALAAVRANLDELGVSAAHYTLIAGDAVATAARHAPPAPWRIVFVDPPYQSDLAVRAVTALPLAHLEAGAQIVIEHDRRHAPPDEIGSLLRNDERRYGDTYLSLYEARR